MVSVAWERAAGTPDPELPGLTIGDLGILRSVEDCDGRTVVTLAPTYSGCPALPEIMADVARRVGQARPVDVRVSLDPPWTTDWITPAGHEKLHAAGIAPPGDTDCPRCGAAATTELARFGATPCRALRRCDACHEPFEQFKRH